MYGATGGMAGRMGQLGGFGSRLGSLLGGRRSQAMPRGLTPDGTRNPAGLAAPLAHAPMAPTPAPTPAAAPAAPAVNGGAGGNIAPPGPPDYSQRLVPNGKNQGGAKK